MIVEGEQKIPGLGVVVKQQLNGHGLHANNRDP
jgi:lipoate-protein ligase B